MQTTEIRETWTALYARLSLDDGNVGESMSIQSQKAILTRNAEELAGTIWRAVLISRYFSQNIRYGISPSMTVWILQTAGRWILPRLRTFLMSFIQGMFPKR